MSSYTRSLFLLAAVFGAFTILPRAAAAQQAEDHGYRTTESSEQPDQQRPDSGYAVTESAADKAADKGDLHADGPVRMARFAYVAGNVTWRAGSTGDWTQAVINMPLRQDAEILVLKGGRAELQFDDGSVLRLGNGALVSLKTLFSDSKGEFTQITLKDGLATLHSRHADAVYEIDTPVVSVKSVGPSQVRLGVDGGSEIAVQMGSATVEGPSGKTEIKEGNYLYLEAANSEFQQKTNPSPDAWDQWNLERNKLIAGESDTYKHVPPNIGLVAEDLDGYGTWHQDPTQGWVWSPTNQPQDWRPYQAGSWTWADPYGWTWVSSEPWGWAPYHYGTWCRLRWGWSWCPGPRSQFWSPGVVSFSTYNGGFCWAPLCPWEVVYPSYCGLGFWGPDWGFSFSIGWCGCYFPFHGRCEGRRFDNHFVNGFHNGGDRFGGGSRFAGLGAAGADHNFVPHNARNEAGATSASREAFGGKGSYSPLSKGTSAFGGGRTLGAQASRTPVSGPTGVASSASRTPTRSFTSSGPSSVAAGRSTYQGSQASGISRSSAGNFAGSSSGMSAAEAARAARASLGNYSGSSSSSRSSGTSGGYSGRTTGGYGESTRSGGTGTYSGGSRTYGGAAPSYRVGPSYRGSGYSSGSAGGSARSGGGATSGGGARSGGGSSGGGGGGGHR